jgi:hypothetical protein
MGLRQTIKSTGHPIRKSIGFRKEIYFEEDDRFDLELVDLNEIGRWFKHPNLNGWMEALYRAKGGDGDFNCRPVKLDIVDLLDLRFAVQFGRLPITAGWGFGVSDGGFINDLDVINRAIQDALRERTVFYECEW